MSHVFNNVFNKGVVRDGLEKFKMNRNITTVFFDVSQYAIETLPQFSVCQYTEKWKIVKVYEDNKRFISLIEDLIKINQTPKSFLLITILKGVYIYPASTSRIHYFVTNIPIPPKEA